MEKAAFGRLFCSGSCGLFLSALAGIVHNSACWKPVKDIHLSSLEVIILAAGQGSRMKSALPKVLHPIGGKPMLAHVLSAARALAAKRIHVVVGHGAEQVKQALADQSVQWVLQAQQLGTGHAVAQAMIGQSRRAGARLADRHARKPGRLWPHRT